jgi:transcriptional regulator with XRE-family HTH domain
MWSLWMQSVLEAIGMNIKLARTRMSISQAELASRLNLEQSYISRIERGVVAVSCERLYEIIHILSCESKDIFPEKSEVHIKFIK